MEHSVDRKANELTPMGENDEIAGFGKSSWQKGNCEPPGRLGVDTSASFDPRTVACNQHVSNKAPPLVLKLEA